ncbi:MAG: hypothetical protein ACKOSQ_08570, partial [Planctomycetaceae bacterium]
MSFFPSPEPLSASPDSSRYERMLQRAAAGDASGDDSCSWSVDDAAAFWVPGWELPTPQNECFPADLIMSRVANAFIMQTYELPPIGKFFAALTGLRAPVPAGKTPFEGISPHTYCRAAHDAYAPAGEAIGERLHWVGLRALAETRYRRCFLPECQESEPLLGHCLPKATFDNAMRCGLLRSTRSIDASPLTLLITPLDCWRHTMPYITIWDGTSHGKCLYCPYWVHDAISALARLIPALLLDADHLSTIRGVVAESIARDLNFLHDMSKQETRGGGGDGLTPPPEALFAASAS